MVLKRATAIAGIKTERQTDRFTTLYESAVINGKSIKDSKYVQQIM